MKSRVCSTSVLFSAKGGFWAEKNFLRFFPKTSPDCGTIQSVGLNSRVTVRIVPQNNTKSDEQDVRSERDEKGRGKRSV